jgi:hypothetical protein
MRHVALQTGSVRTISAAADFNAVALLPPSVIVSAVPLWKVFGVLPDLNSKPDLFRSGFFLGRPVPEVTG